MRSAARAQCSQSTHAGGSECWGPVPLSANKPASMYYSMEGPENILLRETSWPERTNSMWFHVYEVSGAVRSRDRKQDGGARGWGVGGG